MYYLASKEYSVISIANVCLALNVWGMPRKFEALAGLGWGATWIVLGGCHAVYVQRVFVIDPACCILDVLPFIVELNTTYRFDIV